MNADSKQHFIRFNSSTRFAISSAGLAMLTGAPAAEAQIEFAEPIEYPVIGRVAKIELAHLNIDALPDIVMLHEFGDVTVYMNHGENNFEFALHIGPGLREGRDLAVGDISGDGLDDFVWLDQDRLFLFINDGSGYDGDVVEMPRFSGHPRGVVLGDFDDDGDVDLVIAVDRQVQLFHNLNNKTLQLVDSRSLPSSVTHAEDLKLGDVNQDGDIDVVVLATDGYEHYLYGYKIDDSIVSALLNDGEGRFGTLRNTPTPYGNTHGNNYPSDIALGDFDGDGDRDVVVSAFNFDAAEYDRIGFLENNGDGTFTQPETEILLDTNGYLKRIAASLADLDLDGDLDVCVSHGWNVGHIHIIENLGGTGGFALGGVLIGEAGMGALDLGDMNHDGTWDLVSGHRNEINVYHNVSPISGPTLNVTNLARGEQAVWTVVGAEPGEPVYFLMNPRGIVEPTAGLSTLGGLTIDLGHKWRLLGQRQADGEGMATLSRQIADLAPFGRYSFQAVMRRGSGGGDSVKTNFALRALTN